MRKMQELTDPASCINRARVNELTFVLLGRDVAAPATIRFWVAERVRLGKNTMHDEQIREALLCAEMMERERGMWPAAGTVAETAVNRVLGTMPLEST